MSKRQQPRSLIISVLGIIILLLSIGIYYYLAVYRQGINSQTNTNATPLASFISAISEAISQFSWSNVIDLIASLAAAIGLVFLAVQINEQRKEQKYQSFIRVIDELQSKDFRRQTRFVYSHEPEELVISRLKIQELETVEDVTAVLESLGYRVKNGQIPEKEFKELFSDLVVRCGQRLFLHVDDQRKKRNDQNDPEDQRYRANFLWLVRKCKYYRLERARLELLQENIPLDQLLKIEPMTIFKPISNRKTNTHEATHIKDSV